jgi:peptidoglycan-N-acetylglucosamine deacetylase
VQSNPSKQSHAKGIATLSLDLDNEWSYMKTHGDSGWESFPSYLDVAVPRFLALFERFKIKATVFVVGQDAALEKNELALKSIAGAGHEIGNHSFAHEPWLHLYPDEKVKNEIIEAETVIQNVTGVRPVGFRGPGYSLSQQVIRILAERGYLFDASTLPTFLGPIGRAYYFMTSRLDHSQRQERKILFGSFKDGFRPIDPYLWQVDGKTLLEIPVTTFPGLRIPFHVSYLLYLSRFSRHEAEQYFRTALWCCRIAGTAPSLLLHPLDLLGKDDVRTLSFFPGMDMDATVKLERVTRFLLDFQRHFTILPLGVYSQTLRNTKSLKLRNFLA